MDQSLYPRFQRAVNFLEEELRYLHQSLRVRKNHRRWFLSLSSSYINQSLIQKTKQTQHYFFFFFESYSSRNIVLQIPKNQSAMEDFSFLYTSSDFLIKVAIFALIQILVYLILINSSAIFSADEKNGGFRSLRPSRLEESAACSPEHQNSRPVASSRCSEMISMEG